MIETICKDCGDRYPLGQDHECKKRPAKKSTAALKEVHPNGTARTAAGDERHGGSKGARPPPVGKDRLAPIPAGVESRPSILNSREHYGEYAPEAPPVDPRLLTDSDMFDPAQIISAELKRRGRPKSITDMPTYKRDKQREYRAKAKERP